MDIVIYRVFGLLDKDKSCEEAKFDAKTWLKAINKYKNSILFVKYLLLYLLVK